MDGGSKYCWLLEVSGSFYFNKAGEMDPPY